MPRRLIAVDWGTTNLRVCLLEADGQQRELRSAPSGILQIQNARYEEALLSLCADWISADTVLIAGGMIGSRQGWIEVPYLRGPAGLSDAARALVPLKLLRGATLWFVPGVHHADDSGLDDVMRGEETQIWGDSPPPGALSILPGTHSKWASIDHDGRIGRFHTWMTGELYAVLTGHSILGRLMQPGSESPDAFILGAQRGLAEPAQLGRLIFTARTAGLMNRLRPQALPDYLSGLLIGAEIGGACATFGVGLSQSSPRNRHPGAVATQALPAVRLIGEPALCARYAQTARLAGLEPDIRPPGLAAVGAWRIAQAAGLIT